MQYIKKSIFAPLVLFLTAYLLYFFKLVLDKYLEVFFGAWGGLYEFGLVALVIILISLSYCLYITFTQNIKYFLGLAIPGSLLPFLFLSPALALVTGIGFFISFSIVYFNLLTNLKTYTNFQPGNLLSPPVKMLCTLILLSLTLSFYFHSNSIIAKEGFKIPDQIMEWAVNLSLNQAGIPVKGVKYLAQQPTITEDQLKLLRQNPEILKQFGLDPKDLDSLVPSTNTNKPKSQNSNAVNIIPSIPGANLKDIIKAQISDSLDQLIKPYMFAIPFVLAFLFYSLASFCLWIFSIFLSPLIMLIFYIFEKTSFTKFTTEARTVKKIIV